MDRCRKCIKFLVVLLNLSAIAMLQDGSEHVAQVSDISALSLSEYAAMRKMDDMTLQACATYERMRVQIEQLIARCDSRVVGIKEDIKLTDKDYARAHGNCAHHEAYKHYVYTLGKVLHEYVDSYKKVSSKLKKLPGNAWNNANSVNVESKRMLVLKTAVLSMQVQQVYTDSLAQSCRGDVFESFQEIFARCFLLGGLSGEKDTRETRVLINEDISYSMCRVVRVFELHEMLQLFPQARELALVRERSEFSKCLSRMYLAAKMKCIKTYENDQASQLFEHITQTDYERLLVFIICVQPGDSFDKAFAVVQDLEGDVYDVVDVIERYYIEAQ